MNYLIEELPYQIEETHCVLSSETANNMGSGLLPVFSTPSLVALMEHTACLLIANLPTETNGALTDGITTVGTKICVDHLKACLPDEKVKSVAQLLAVEGREYRFQIKVYNEKGELLATATHTRFAVSSQRFMEKVNGK